MRIDENTRDNVVELYTSGTRIDDIVADTGVKRPTIYYILRQRGLRPTRTARNAPGPDLHDLQAQLNGAQREIGKLEQQLELAHKMIAKILTGIEAVDKTMAGALSAAVEAAGIPVKS